MIDEPPPPPSGLTPDVAQAELPAATLPQQLPDGRVVIDLTQLIPTPLAEECTEEPANPLATEIVVCAATGPAPRLGPKVGPVDDGFGSAIPRARIKLSDNASAEANVHKTPVGGFDADGAEVRVKIDF